MKLIATKNPKGGTGKTTSTVNIVACLVERGFSVGIADTDVNRSACEWRDSGGLDGKVKVVRLETTKEIYAIRENPEFKGLDYVFIDGKADGFPELFAAGEVADLVLFTCSIASIETQNLKDAFAPLKHVPVKKAFFVNRARRGTDNKAVQELLEGVADVFGIPCLKSVIYFSDIYQRAYAEGKSVFQYSDFKKQQADVQSLTKEVLEMVA